MGWHRPGMPYTVVHEKERLARAISAGHKVGASGGRKERRFMADRRFLGVLTALAAGGGALAVVGADAAPSGWHAGLGALILWIGALPTVIDWRFADVGKFRVVAAAGGAMAVSYGAPVFAASFLASPGGPVHFYGVYFSSTEALFPLLVLALACAAGAAFFAAVYAIRAASWPPGVRFTVPRLSRPRALILLWGLLGYALADQVFPAVHALPSLRQLAAPAGYIAFAAFFALALRRELGPVHGAAVFLVGFGLLWAGLLSRAALAPLMVYGLIGGLVLWRVRGRFPIKLAMAGLLLVPLMYNATQVYRTYAWSRHALPPPSFVEKVATIGSFAVFDLTGIRLGAVPNASISREPRIGGVISMRILQRFSHIALLGRAVAVTPEERPFWGGASYAPMLTSFVPRVLWPGKPREEVGGTFAADYWHVGDKAMSMNIPWMVELYLNFGVVGALAGMAVFGVLFGVLDRVFNDPRSTDLEAAIGLVVLLPFVYPDSNFSLMMGSMLPLVAVLWVYFFLGARIPLPAVFSR